MDLCEGSEGLIEDESDIIQQQVNELDEEVKVNPTNISMLHTIRVGRTYRASVARLSR